MGQIPDFIGRRVVVYSGSSEYEYEEEGVLRTLGGEWLVIENDEGEWLLFPVSTVHMIRVLADADKNTSW